ncbi:MAG TPA: hypothetical protein DCP91_00650 [Eggerthellaceae bacterium]|nr:hypothetical protein [Eggerthellaceae bacterium]
MRFHLTGIDEGKRQIHMAADDKSMDVTIDAAGEAWTGKATDLEVLNAPNGATVYYIADDGTKSYKNYRFDAEGATVV